MTDETDNEALPSAEEMTEALDRMPAWELDTAPREAAETMSESRREAETAPRADDSGSSDIPSPGADAPGSPAPPPLIRILEALLFVGGAPLTAERAAEVVRGLGEDDFRQAIDDLARTYRTQGRPYQIQLQERGYVLTLRSRFANVREKLYGGVREARLSQPAVDVLSLVAYKQPATRQEIDSLRGADSGSLLRLLIRHGLIALHRGEDNDPRYVTTPRFLQLFGLTSLDDLPQTQDLQRL